MARSGDRELSNIMKRALRKVRGAILVPLRLAGMCLAGPQGIFDHFGLDG